MYSYLSSPNPIQHLFLGRIRKLYLEEVRQELILELVNKQFSKQTSLKKVLALMYGQDH